MDEPNQVIYFSSIPIHINFKGKTYTLETRAFCALKKRAKFKLTSIRSAKLIYAETISTWFQFTSHFILFLMCWWVCGLLFWGFEREIPTTNFSTENDFVFFLIYLQFIFMSNKTSFNINIQLNDSNWFIAKCDQKTIVTIFFIINCPEHVLFDKL